MISDTEDECNDAENSALHHRNKYILKCFIIENYCFKIVIQFHIIVVFTVYSLNKYSLGENETIEKSSLFHTKTIWKLSSLIKSKEGKYCNTLY